MARNKTYVCFDADTDMWAYKYMVGWKNNDRIDFDFFNAHDLNTLRAGSSKETIYPKLRERMKQSKLFIVLVGDNTKNLFQFVRWEMELALELGVPIVAVYLNKSKSMDTDVCPPILRDKLVLHIPFKQAAIKYAIDHWIGIQERLRQNSITGPRVLTDTAYQQLDI